MQRHDSNHDQLSVTFETEMLKWRTNWPTCTKQKNKAPLSWKQGVGSLHAALRQDIKLQPLVLPIMLRVLQRLPLLVLVLHAASAQQLSDEDLRRVGDIIQQGSSADPRRMTDADMYHHTRREMSAEDHEDLLAALTEWKTAVGVTEEQFVARHGPKALFTRLDSDSDGTLSGDEAQAGLHALQQLPPSAEWQRMTDGTRFEKNPEHPKHKHKGMDFDMFAKMLLLDKHRHRNPGKYFVQLDKDGDGLLSKEEFLKMKELVKNEPEL